MIVEVVDAADPRLDAFRWRERQLTTRRDRRERVASGLFVAEGDLVVERALTAGCNPVALLCSPEVAESLDDQVDPSTPVYVGSDALRKEVTGLGVPLRATGLFARPQPHDLDELVAGARRVVIAEAVDNPTNLGAVVRSAAALGWDALVLDATSADPLARRSLRVSMGSGLVLPFARLAPGDTVANLLSRHDCTAVALSPDPAAVDIAHLARPEGRVALLLGSERAGLTDQTMESATVVARIPMYAGIDSLNVAAAAAIALHALGPDSPG